MTEQNGCGCGGHGHAHQGTEQRGGCGGHGHGGGGCGCGGHGRKHGVRTENTPADAPDDISGGREQLGLRAR